VIDSLYTCLTTYRVVIERQSTYLSIYTGVKKCHFLYLTNYTVAIDSQCIPCLHIQLFDESQSNYFKIYTFVIDIVYVFDYLYICD